MLKLEQFASKEPENNCQRRFRRSGKRLYRCQREKTWTKRLSPFNILFRCCSSFELRGSFDYWGRGEAFGEGTKNLSKTGCLTELMRFQIV